MNNPGENPRPHADHTQPFRFERLIMMALAVALVVVMVVFVFLNPPLNDTTRLVLFVLVAMMAGGFIAFLPGGVLKVGNTFKGVAIKATGGAAAFLIVLYALFTYVSPTPEPVQMLPLDSADLRSEFPRSDARYLDGRVALIVPVAFSDPEGKPVVVERLAATLRLGPKPIASFSARHITELQQGVTTGPWIPYLGAYDPGAQFVGSAALSLAFYGSDSERWGDLLSSISGANSRLAVVEVVATLSDGSSLTRSCSFELYRVDGRDLGDPSAGTPDNISKDCVR